jgi:hypothetical protein
MMREPIPPVLQGVGKGLRARLAPVTKEPLPKRWVELIHYLNEIERREAARESDQGGQDH